MERGPLALFGAIIAVGLGPALWMGVQLGPSPQPGPARPPAGVNEQGAEKAGQLLGGTGAGAESSDSSLDPAPRGNVIPLTTSPEAKPSPSTSTKPSAATTSPTTTDPTTPADPGTTAPPESTTVPVPDPTEATKPPVDDETTDPADPADTTDPADNDGTDDDDPTPLTGSVGVHISSEDS
ncbi:hypothetical protein [Paractinoplanes hotanensis]|uniref:Uncharacterized protein n=1 Tax=Paractinoplanes hotanensis TaxID=2906497 RepID=A0ABT0Y3R8_9ACTN|nr:hypothetical protein [Actinoplanes hotanensis]MCM4080683.1 hypothetical protein [Actinoplanes hotanensis]